MKDGGEQGRLRTRRRGRLRYDDHINHDPEQEKEAEEVKPGGSMLSANCSLLMMTHRMRSLSIQLCLFLNRSSRIVRSSPFQLGSSSLTSQSRSLQPTTTARPFTIQCHHLLLLSLFTFALITTSLCCPHVCTCSSELGPIIRSPLQKIPINPVRSDTNNETTSPVHQHRQHHHSSRLEPKPANTYYRIIDCNQKELDTVAEVFSKDVGDKVKDIQAMDKFPLGKM